MMAVRYHGCTCHLRYSAAAAAANTANGVKKSDNDKAATAADNDNETNNESNGSNKNDNAAANDKEADENKSQPWYFHVVASVILVVHGLTFLVPHDPETEDTDMMRIIGRWFGFDWEWMKHFTPYAQVCRCSSLIDWI